MVWEKVAVAWGGGGKVPAPTAVQNPESDAGISKLGSDIGTGHPITTGWGSIISSCPGVRAVLTCHGSCLFFRNLRGWRFIVWG